MTESRTHSPGPRKKFTIQKLTFAERTARLKASWRSPAQSDDSQSRPQTVQEDCPVPAEKKAPASNEAPTPTSDTGQPDHGQETEPPHAPREETGKGDPDPAEIHARSRATDKTRAHQPHHPLPTPPCVEGGRIHLPRLSQSAATPARPVGPTAIGFQPSVGVETRGQRQPVAPARYMSQRIIARPAFWLSGSGHSLHLRDFGQRAPMVAEKPP